MSLRDYFAGQVLGLMMREGVDALVASAGQYEPGKVDAIMRNVARMSYRVADAMIKERDRVG